MNELYSYVSIKSQSAAMCLAKIVMTSKDASLKVNFLNDLKQKIVQPGNEVQASLCLGEFGKLMDLSTV